MRTIDLDFGLNLNSAKTSGSPVARPISVGRNVAGARSPHLYTARRSIWPFRLIDPYGGYMATYSITMIGYRRAASPNIQLQRSQRERDLINGRDSRQAIP